MVTEAGAPLLRRVSPAIEMLDDLEGPLLPDGSELAGRLRLSLPQSFEPWWKLLGMFQRAYPGIKVSIHSTERRVDLVSDGVDVALRVGALNDDSIVAR